MMKHLIRAAAITLLATAAVPAAAATFVFTQPTGATTAASFSAVDAGVTATATGYRYSGATAGSTYTPEAFADYAQANGAGILGTGPVTRVNVTRNAYGLGVLTSGESSTGANNTNQGNQVDNDGINELLVVDFTPAGAYSLATATFTAIDDNDTLQLFGVSDTGAVTKLGFDGAFVNSFNGGLDTTSTGSSPNATYNVTFNTAGYSSFWFTPNNDAADGFRLNSLSVAAVPEPASWAMMIAGFGLVGSSMRRRGTVRMATSAI